MRLSRRLASVTVAVALVLFVPYEALPHARGPAAPSASQHARVAAAPPAARSASQPAAAEPFGAACRIRVHGSQVTAYCHNPYPDTDRVSLHVECARWWDLDIDSAPADAGPAQTVRLTGRCWKEVGSVWVGHQRGD
ncbi:hypothetical protein [Streptomyces bullii]|uniref:Secreted protein n=1 Tax=Streptomyces bullii TaxID=349910 RepID=A0ABW0UWH1_9ACTN